MVTLVAVGLAVATVTLATTFEGLAALAVLRDSAADFSVTLVAFSAVFAALVVALVALAGVAAGAAVLVAALAGVAATVLAAALVGVATLALAGVSFFTFFSGCSTPFLAS